jgi:hypothetical protein
MEELDPDKLLESWSQEGHAGVPNWSYAHEGCTLTFWPIPKTLQSRGRPGIRTLGFQSGEGQIVDSVTPLRNSLRKKAKKYGHPPMPVVIAVNALDVNLESDRDVREALFGTGRTVVRPSGEFSELHQRDGLWYGNTGPQYRNVSAVLMVEGFTPWTIGVVQTRLFLNPWAAHPISQAFHELPRATMEGEKMVYEDGSSLADLLGLPPCWPLDSSENPLMSA